MRSSHELNLIRHVRSLECNGVELAKESQTPVQNAPFAERADVKEIGQDLQKQGAE